MSLYIPGMELPTSCGKCKFHKPVYHTQYCIIAERNCAPHETRKDWCPLVKIPRHGRFCVYDGVIVQNDAEPTIIPADKKEGVS